MEPIRLVPSGQRRRTVNRTINRTVKVDRFTALPLDVAYHILSFLPITDLTRVGVLSKKCRSLYLSSPTLNFTDFPSESTCTVENRLTLLYSLAKCFAHRDFKKVQSFNFDWVYEYQVGETNHVEKCWVISMINNAIASNAEKIKVSYEVSIPLCCEGSINDTHPERGSTQIEVPFDMIADGCLKSLSLDIEFAFFETPDFSTCSVSNLVFLSLRNVTMEDDKGFCKWVSLYCKFIKDLRLECVDGLRRIDIRSASLESFKVESPSCVGLCHVKLSGGKLEKIDMNWIFSDPESWPKRNSLEISAPNLKTLIWEGHMMNCQNFGELNCLEEVELSLMADGLDDFGRKLHQFLTSIRRVKVLTIDHGTTKTLFKEGYTPPPLLNCECLKVRSLSSIEDKLVLALVSLFKGLPNLNNLGMCRPVTLPIFFRTGTAATTSGFKKGYWIHRNLECIPKLKAVAIELTEGINGFEFAKYLLEHAQNLEDMLVVCSPDQLDFAVKLRASKMISNATVGYLVKPDPVEDIVQHLRDL